MELIRETLIVDVSHVDWSRHPAWSRDFEVDEMFCASSKPEWAGDVIAYQREYLTDDEEREIRREQRPRARSPE